MIRLIGLILILLSAIWYLSIKFNDFLERSSIGEEDRQYWLKKEGRRGFQE